MTCQIPISQIQSFAVNRTTSRSLLYKNSVIEALVPCSRETARLNARWKMNGRLRISRVVQATVTEKPMKRISADEPKEFADEMRAVVMKQHTRDQAKEGEKDLEGLPVEKWEPTVEGYIRFLIDSKVVYDTLESIISDAACPSYANFRSTGLERSIRLANDVEWFKQQGYAIAEPSSPGLTYSHCLKELSKNDPQAFICHFYNIYFGHFAGGRMIGKMASKKILNGKELEFYKCEGDLRRHLQSVREKINQLANEWSREEKNHCLEETEKSFKYSTDIFRLMLA